MSAKQYEVTVRLQSNYPRDINMEGELYWWNGTEIADEIASWLEDLGFDVQVTVKEVDDDRS
jgi:sulfatase maturation enzyme AslB (radical SAM superfamily)